MIRPLVLALITIYQKMLSPDHSWLKHRYPGGVCRYRPTCSEYAKQSIVEHGTVKGLFLGLARVLRCHPWADPGFDPILKKGSN